MYSSSYSYCPGGSGGSHSTYSSYSSPSYSNKQATSRYRDMVSNMYGGVPGPQSGYSSKYTSQSGAYSSTPSYSSYTATPSTPSYSSYSAPSYSYSAPPARGSTLPPSRGASIAPPNLDRYSRQRTVFRTCLQDDATSSRHIRLKSPSIPRERTRDELIDSIVHTRTREHRAMPGFKSATDFDERRSLRVDCDKVFKGIIIGNGETICNMTYLKNIGVTHVLNTATEHVVVNPAKFPAYDIKYHGFHVDDLPDSNISRYFHTTTKFIDQAVSSGGLVVVNCVMGWSRSATCVAAYLMMKHSMSATKALELIRQNRSIRPNAGFLQQLADLENTLSKRVVW